jgi:acid phosphatase
MQFWMRRVAASLVLLAIAIAAPGAPAGTRPAVPTPDHTVVVVLENHSFADIMSGDKAPFIGQLARHGASFTNSFAIAHPSQPNYLALFSGSTHGVTDDRPHVLEGPTLAGALRAVASIIPGNPLPNPATSNGISTRSPPTSTSFRR